jgi:transposase, IS30 family
VFRLGRPALSVDVQRRFWVLIRDGEVVGDAADAMGVSRTVAWRWFRNAGGVMPVVLPLVVAGSLPSRLSFGEREELACRRAGGEGVRMIARALGRSPSTISRELARGIVRRKSGYRASMAQAGADERARRPKMSTLAGNNRLREHVQDQLRAKDSPEQISRRLLLDFPNDPEMRVSHETIYQGLYVQGRGALNRELIRRHPYARASARRLARAGVPAGGLCHPAHAPADRHRPRGMSAKSAGPPVSSSFGV